MRSVITYGTFAFSILTAFISGFARADQECVKPDAASPLTDNDRKAVVITTRFNPAVFRAADFSLAKTLDNILRTARDNMSASISAAEREALLDTLLERFKQQKLTSDDSGLTFNAIQQPGFATLSAPTAPAARTRTHPIHCGCGSSGASAHLKLAKPALDCSS
jgi:hypothetical protein